MITGLSFGVVEILKIINFTRKNNYEN